MQVRLSYLTDTADDAIWHPGGITHLDISLLTHRNVYWAFQQPVYTLIPERSLLCGGLLGYLVLADHCANQPEKTYQ